MTYVRERVATAFVAVVVASLVAGCASRSELAERTDEAEPVQIVFAGNGVLTFSAVTCAGLRSYLPTEDTTFYRAGLRGQIDRHANRPQAENPSDSIRFVDARKWVILSPGTAEADTLCLGDLWGLERRGRVEGFADSLVVLVNGLLYDSTAASRRRTR